MPRRLCLGGQAEQPGRHGAKGVVGCLARVPVWSRSAKESNEQPGDWHRLAERSGWIIDERSTLVQPGVSREGGAEGGHIRLERAGKEARRGTTVICSCNSDWPIATRQGTMFSW